MPEFPLVDSHVHLWDQAVQPYPWLNDMPALNRRHTPAEFRAAGGPVAVAKLIFVQCGGADALIEVAWVDRLAREEPRIAGIVAQAPLEQGEVVASWLERLATIPRVKGVRRLLQDEPDDAFCLRPEFVRGVRLLPRFGFSFDLCIYHRQLANVIRLVRQCPQVSFVLDHLGKPGIRARQLDPWRAELRELATLPNVVCKLSGVATEADHAAWTAADLRPYLDHALECFGPARLLFGSDWPVSTLATDYPRWVATVDAALEGCTTEERQRIFARNAEAFYRI
jgi:L-fuconolactonase